MDSTALAVSVLETARKSSLMIATAESCTGGLISGVLTEIAGSSDVFDRGFVTYSNSAKVGMLGVQQRTLDSFGAVSEQTAQEMALGALSGSLADVAVSVTGVAGPGGTAHKPEGLVCFGIARKGAPVRTEAIEFGAIGRANVRAATVHHALELLLAACSQAD